MHRFYRHLAALQPEFRALLRIVTALLYLEHATQKLFHFPPMHMPAGAHPPSGGPPAWFFWIGVLEFVGSLLLIVGFWTRVVAFILAGEMAVAYWMAHAPHSFFPLLNGGEAAILFCFIYLYIAAAGGGAWSIDKALKSEWA